MSNRLEAYASYLLGEHWKRLKHRVTRARGHKCEGCGSANFIECHHLIYRDPLESCTEEDVMLLCGGCHGAVHADKPLDRFLKSQSASPASVRRKIVMGHLERWWGGKDRLTKHRRKMDQHRAIMRQELDARPPLRECRRPRKRWLDYSPDLIQPKTPWTV